MASTLTGHATYDLGPMLYWLLAVPARFGGPAALTAAMTVFNAALIVCCVVLARRRGGDALMIASALAIALMSRSFGSEALHGIWNPSAALFALTLLCFLSWSLACGEQRLLPAAVLVASFVMQCHLAYVAPAVGLLLVAVLGLVIERASKRRARLHAGLQGAGERPLWRAVAAALVVAVICWCPAVANELTSSPGNLSALASAASARQQTEGASAGWHALARGDRHPAALAARSTTTGDRSAGQARGSAQRRGLRRYTRGGRVEHPECPACDLVPAHAVRARGDRDRGCTA